MTAISTSIEPRQSDTPQLACPHCGAPTSSGARYCARCGAITAAAAFLTRSSSPPPSPAPAPAKSKRVRNLRVGLLLLAVGIAGFVVYPLIEHRMALDASALAEQNAANHAPNQLQFTCITVRKDPLIHTTYWNLTFEGRPTGSALVEYYATFETLGIHNPTKFIIGATWTLSITFLDNRTYPTWLTAPTRFQLGTVGSAYPTFEFRYYSGFPPSPSFGPPNVDPSKFSITLDAAFTVSGTYGDYLVRQRSSYSSISNTGDGLLTSQMPLVNGKAPQC